MTNWRKAWKPVYRHPVTAKIADPQYLLYFRAELYKLNLS